MPRGSIGPALSGQEPILLAMYEFEELIHGAT